MPDLVLVAGPLPPDAGQAEGACDEVRTHMGMAQLRVCRECRVIVMESLGGTDRHGQ